MDLANSSEEDTAEVMKGYQLFGTVKEIGVDDTGLRDFHRLHFSSPLYRDDGLVFYNDLFGKRRIKLTTYNPFTLYKGYTEMKRRLKDKNLQGNLAGEGMVRYEHFSNRKRARLLANNFFA
jgi:hypothetical protein